MKRRSTRMLNKIGQVVASADKTRVLVPDAIVTHVHLLKKGFVGVCGAYGKVRQLGTTGVWVKV